MGIEKGKEENGVDELEEIVLTKGERRDEL